MDPLRDRFSLVGYADKSPGISLLDNAVKLDDPESLNFTIDGSQDQIPATVSYVLRKACVHGSRNMVKFILKNLGQIQRSKLDKSLVETCIRHSGDRDIVKSLFNVGISRTNLTDLGDTDVHLAVRYDKSLLLEDLLTNQEGLERINICNHYGVFPLLLAMKLKHVSCFKVLVHAGADVNQKLEGLGEEPELAEIYSEFTAQIGFFSKPLPGDSLMHVLLKKLGIRIFYKNVQEYFSYESIFDVLLNCSNLDFTVTNAEGRSILDEAIISLCDPRVLDRLIEKGCCLLLSNPYHYASFEDSVERLEVIKSLGYDLNATDSSQFSPLFVACLDHNVKVVSWLLENGANPTTYVNSRVLQNWIANVSKISDNLIPDQRIVVTKMTPVHVTLLGSMSVFMSAVPIVEMMCAHGANINAQTSAGETPLYYATRDALGDDNFPLLPAYFEPFGPEELLFILLIQAGADPEIGTDAGKFPIMFCIPESLSRIALMFLEVSTNLMKYFAVRENERKACRVSDMSFLPISESSLRTLITNPRKLQTSFEYGVLSLTTHRLLWRDHRNRNCVVALSLSLVVYIEEQASGFAKSAKIIVHLSPTPGNKASGPTSHSPHSFIRLSFREAGQKQFFRLFQEQLKTRVWEQKVEPVASSNMLPRHRPGIVGIERSLQKKHHETNKNISVAFEDLSKLIEKAKDMVSLSKTIATKIKDKQGDITEDETVKFKSYLLSMGIPNPVTRETHGAGDKYYVELAKQLASVLEKPVEELGGMMTLTDVYCRVNRARGMELLSPEDLLHACELMELLKLPIRLRTFDSGVMVLQSKSQNEEEVISKTTTLVEDKGSLTSEELAKAVGVSVILAKERLLLTEKVGGICRDETVEGLKFFPNLFLTQPV